MIKVIDFYADWCGPCHVMKPIIESVEKELAGKVEFAKVNVDENQEMVAKYQVMSIPTYVVLDNGQEKNRITGATSKEGFLKFINYKES